VGYNILTTPQSKRGEWMTDAELYEIHDLMYETVRNAINDALEEGGDPQQIRLIIADLLQDISDE
jgi:hypothetical protein